MHRCVKSIYFVFVAESESILSLRFIYFFVIGHAGIGTGVLTYDQCEYHRI